MGCGSEPLADPKGRDRGANVKVLDVVDGDTIAVRLRREEVKVRLVGIDTPELFGGSECGGEEASASMRRLLDSGDWVELVPDRGQPGRDRFGRLLRYVEYHGDDVAREQLLAGYAEVPVVGENPRRLPSYRRAEAEARAEARGIWGTCRR